MRAGANDYLMKDNLLRLAPTIERVLQEAENHRARKRAEEEQARLNAQLDDERRRLNNIIASVPGVVWEAWGQPNAATQHIDFVSEYVKTMLGYSVEEWVSTPNFWLSIVHPDDKEMAAQVTAADFAEGRSQSTLEFRWLTKSGNVIWAQSNYAVILDDDGTPLGMRGVTIDITKRKRAEEALRVSEEQLRQSQKLEAVGQLAGGIAHDFNNLLTVISGYCDLTLMKMRPEEPTRANIQEVKKAGERAAGLTRQLLAFSRRQVLQPKVLDLNAIVTDVNKMLRRLIGEDVDLTTVLDPSLGQINADPGQIEQVIINLAVNARDAMPQGGKLIFETANVYLDNEYLRNHTSVRPGNYVMFALSDTGTGMDADTKARIFEPFFTTKGPGKGTGLGLSTVYGIVKQSDGYIWVYSELGQGTTFKVYLPRVDGPRVDTVLEPLADLPRGRETVLVTEDEDPVRRLIKTILESNGYEVLEASCGEDALALYKEHTGPVDLIVTDVVMPKMSGRELAENLKTLSPAIKVLYLSGYTDDAIVRHGLLDQRMSFLQKPFTPDALLHKVREVLAAKSD
jgi:PAS domain S-box-containing protein